MRISESPLVSRQAYEAAFADGLRDLLDGADISAFILVCANAAMTPGLQRKSLEPSFARLSAEVVAALKEGKSLPVNEDDQQVFLKLMALGLDAVEKVERRREGCWELQFNLLRSFRPQRISGRPVHGIRAAFDPEAFNFNRPFMLREQVWEGRLDGRDLSLYYNKYPFVGGHALLVPERENGHAQFLHEYRHHDIWELTGSLSQGLPGIGFGYNAYGACASVNHLHFQMFVRDTPWPVQAGHWRHHGGSSPYPLEVQVFDDADSAWAALHALHEREQTYNLLYLPGRMYLYPRQPQGRHPLPAWTTGFTWYEASGGFVTFSRAEYERLSVGEIERALAELRVPG